MALNAEEVYAILKKQIQSGGGAPGPAGVGIQKIEKTGTEELVDTYTITYTNGQTTKYTVTNGADGPKGEPGQTGATPNIQIGEVQTLEPEEQATASISGTPENPQLNLGIPKGQSGTADIPRQEMQSTNTSVTLQPNVLYVFPEMASLTVTLRTPSDTNVANEYHFFFTSGATATTLTLNDVLSDAYSIEANMKYEVSILEGVAYIKGVSTNEA